MNRIIAGIISAIIAVGTLSLAAPAQADFANTYGPEVNTYTVKDVKGTKATGFQVWYWNGNFKELPPIGLALHNERRFKVNKLMVREQYRDLAALRKLIRNFSTV